MIIDKVAWLELADGKVLCARSEGKDVFYLPGGKREQRESDVETLTREIMEELRVKIDPATAKHAGTYTAQAHGHQAGIEVQMTCYTASYEGTPTASAEIAEIQWLTYGDRDQVAPVDQLIFDHLHATGDLS